MGIGMETMGKALTVEGNGESLRNKSAVGGKGRLKLDTGSDNRTHSLGLIRKMV